MRPTIILLGASLVAACDPVDSTPPGLDAATADAAIPTDAPPAVDAALPVTSDLVASFPGSQNPDGRWTYGFAATANAPLTPFPHLVNAPNTPTWTDESPLRGGVHGVVWKNATSAPLYQVPPGAVSAHPGSAGETTIVRYTAAFTGTYTARFQALDGDAGTAEVVLRVKGTSVHRAQAATTFELPATRLTAGDTLEVWVGSLGDWAQDNTPIALSVTGTPGT